VSYKGKSYFEECTVEFVCFIIRKMESQGPKPHASLDGSEPLRKGSQIPSRSSGRHQHTNSNLPPGEDKPSRPSRQSSFMNLSFTPLSLPQLQSRKQLRQSYENLVALANAQEALVQTRKIVWRDRGEPAVELANVEEVFEHALRGGARK
jgi:hypothetical protein